LTVEWITKKIAGKNETLEKLQNLENKPSKNYKIVGVKITAIVVLLLLLWNPIRHIIKNHPYQYVYFNELAGGINNAYGNYEMDYYYHSTREASEWILKNVPPNPPGEQKIKVVSYHASSAQYFFRNDTANFQVNFARWYERGNSDWDYGIFTITGMMPEEIKSAHFPPKNTVYQVKVDGKPICLVLKRESKEDYIGAQLKNNKEFTTAIEHLKNAIETDNTNIPAYLNLIESYFNIGNLDSAKFYTEQLLEFVPKYETANYMLAYYYNFKQQPDSVLKTLKMIREHNPKFKAAYHFAYQIYMQQKDVKNAEKMMLLLMETDQMDDQSFNQIISIYKAQGLDERGAYKKAYRKYIKALEKLGRKEKAKTYQDALKKM
jgi:tetratricopeptide (TPR) repeat protein